MKLQKLISKKNFKSPVKIVNKFDFIVNRTNVENIFTDKHYNKNTIGDALSVIPQFVYKSDLRYALKSIRLNSNIDLLFNTNKKIGNINTESIIGVKLNLITLDGNGKLL